MKRVVNNRVMAMATFRRKKDQEKDHNKALEPIGESGATYASGATFREQNENNE